MNVQRTTSLHHLPAASAVLLCVTLTLLPGRADAGEVERLGIGPVPAATFTLQGIESGQWRAKTQLIWDDQAAKLSRRSYRIWDAYAGKRYDLFWAPDTAAADASGAISGSGRITWRLPGTSSYDATANLAQLTGTFANGSANGLAELREASGAYYQGSWVDGLMEGTGRLHFENGDEYVGTFKSGRRSGSGTYFYTNGEYYRGGFSNNLMQGLGRLNLADGVSYEAQWHQGIEVGGTRIFAQGAGRATIPVQLREDDVRLGVSVDRRPMRDFRSFVGVMPYISESSQDGLKIYPDDQAILNVWRGKNEIQLSSEQINDIQNNRSFLGPPERYKPVPIIFDVQNRSTKPVYVSGAYLEVERSESDRDPAVQIIGPHPGQCMAGDGRPFGTSFELENFGWSDIENAIISGRFFSESGAEVVPPAVIPVGHISDRAKADAIDALRAAQFDIARMSKDIFRCGKSTSDSTCLALARKAGVFGKLADAVKMASPYFYLPMKSVLAYDWKDGRGVIHHKTSPFTMNLAVGQRETELECGGEGATPEARFKDPFVFKIDAERYRISIPLNEDVPAGVTARWRIQLDAPMSSNHTFKIVAQIGGGRDVASRIVNLLYFKPKPFPDFAVAAGVPDP